MADGKRTPAQQAASRANGRRSRGPRTAAGKVRSRRNALRHGLRASTLELLPPAAGGPAAALGEAVQEELAPANAIEAELAAGIAAALWRLRRARELEEEALRGGTALARLFARSGQPADPLALLLRYRNQALGEVDRLLRLLGRQRGGSDGARLPALLQTAVAPRQRSHDGSANDNRPRPEPGRGAEPPPGAT